MGLGHPHAVALVMYSATYINKRGTRLNTSLQLGLLAENEARPSRGPRPREPFPTVSGRKSPWRGCYSLERRWAELTRSQPTAG
jgi:hypothetical protein